MSYKQLTTSQLNVINKKITEENEYMFDEYIDMLIDRARGHD